MPYLLHLRGARNPFAPLKALVTTRFWALMLVVAIVLGATTTCDKIAIDAADALTYVFIWTCVSTIIMALIAVKRYYLEKNISRSL